MSHLSIFGKDSTGNTKYAQTGDTIAVPSAVPHCYGGFQGANTTIACAQNVWSHITNGTTNLWVLPEASKFTVTNDTFVFAQAGDYFGLLTVSVSGTNGDDIFIRCYNTTQAKQMSYIIGGTVTGAANFMPLALPLYIEDIAVNDVIRFEIENITNNNDPNVRSAAFFISYLHE